MSLRALATAKPSRPSVPFASLVDGDILVPDQGFTCMQPGYPHVVRVDGVGPHVSCCCPSGCGRHYLDGQLDGAGNIVGFRRYR